MVRFSQTKYHFDLKRKKKGKRISTLKVETNISERSHGNTNMKIKSYTFQTKHTNNKDVIVKRKVSYRSRKTTKLPVLILQFEARRKNNSFGVAIETARISE